MPRRPQLCDPLVAPTQYHIVRNHRVNGAAVKNPLEEGAISNPATFKLPHVVLHGVSGRFCDNTTAEQWIRLVCSDTAKVESKGLQKFNPPGNVTCMLRPSYSQGSLLDRYRLRNSGPHDTRIRRPCNLYPANIPYTYGVQMRNGSTLLDAQKMYATLAGGQQCIIICLWMCCLNI